MSRTMSENYCDDCQKIRYENYDEARAKVAQQQPFCKKPLYYYGCPHGNGTHITTKRLAFVYRIRTGQL